MKKIIHTKSASCQSGKSAGRSAFARRLGNFSLLCMFMAALLAISSPEVKAQTPGFSKGGGTSSTPLFLNSTTAFKTQQLYLPGDLTPAPINGNITRIYFRNSVANATGTFDNLKVFMGQTTATVFPGTGSLTFFTGLTQVFNSPSKVLTGNATVGGWFFIDLDTPFAYDNTKTLIMEVQYGPFTGGIDTYSSSSGVVPAHKKLFASSVTATTGTQGTNSWQDLGLDIAPFPACSGMPTAGNAVSSVSTACVGVNFDLSLTGIPLVSGLTYQWQSSPNGTTWTNIAGATNTRLTTSQTSTTFYRANVSCGTNTAASGSVQVTTTVAPFTGTFTIDKNSAVSATNYQSIAAFITDIICKGVSGPVTVNVVAGSGPYNEQMILTPIAGASATNTITFNGNGNKISFANATDNRAVVRLDGADFITINNFQVEASDPTFGWGFHLLNGADNNTISNNTITIINTNATEGASIGIFFTSSTTSASTGNTGNNNIISGNTINGGYDGIFLNSLLTSTGNNQLKNNIIKDFYETGIKISNAKGTLIEGNDISRPARITVSSTFNGIYLTGNPFSTVISKNRIHNSHDAATGTGLTGDVFGIAIFSSDAPTGSENILKNNLVYNINNTGLAYALYNNSSNGAFYYNNTVNLNNTASTGNVRGFFQESAATNIQFINNIISVTGGASAATTRHALYFLASGSSIISNNNVLYAPNGNVGNFSGTNAPTLADWKAANGRAFDQNSLSDNPNFVAPATGNLKPTNSTINNIGQPIAAVTDDITGAPRNPTTPDAGAYEFNSPTTNDAGVTTILAPVSPLAPGTSPVQVVIKNYGNAVLTSVTVNWTVNGVAQTPYAWTGNLPSGVSDLLTIGTFNFTAGPFTLNVCTANPNGVPDENTSNDCINLSGNSCSPLTGTFTIDKTTPASATNFQTFAAAIQGISSCGVSGAVTVNVVAGSGPYNEQITIPVIPGTNAANTITFEGNGNTISFANTSTLRSVVRLDGADFVTFNNFKIEATDPTIGWGFHLLNAADNNKITNNTITIASTSTSESNSVGIVFSNSDAAVTSPGNTGKNNLISGNTINGGYKGIHLNGNIAEASNNQLTNNTIKDFYQIGIAVAAAKGTLVEGNDLTRPGRATVSNPTYGISLSDNSSSTSISKNRIHNTHGGTTTLTGTVYGIFVNGADAPVGSENIVKNNLVYNINTNGTVNALYNFNSDGSYFYNNTVDLSNATSTGALRGFYQTQLATNVKFINNIISITAGTGAKNALYFETATSSITSNNNDLYVPAGNVGTFVSTAFATLANWKTANNNAYDQNSVSDNPNYVGLATGNLQPTAATINNIGQPLTAVPDDITGAPRNPVTPDPGAYEFGAIPIDLSVTAVSGPATTGCGLTSTETITITIRNFGSAAQSAIPVTYSVNGVTNPAANETFAGPIAPNATATYTFATKADLSVSGPYTIIAKTAMPGDGNPANDASTLNLANNLFPSLPVILDFETPATGLPHMKTVIGSSASITEGAGASNGTGSTKGMIMAGISSLNWTIPSGSTDPWTANPDHFAAAKVCISTAGLTPADSLKLSFDLKQLFKTTNANTNFRITVNGTQVGPTYRPPFTGSPIVWNRINVDLTSFKAQPIIEIGFESNVIQEYDNGNGTANLIDNILIRRISPSGIKSESLASQLSVFPNPSKSIFNINLPQGKTNELVVTDLTGKVLKTQTATTGTTQLNLEGTAKGIYLLKVSGENGSAVRKLIVE